MPSKTSAIRTALQSIDDEINGIVHAFDEEEKFLEIFSVKEEEITEKSVAKVETIKTALKGTFEDFEIAEVVADRDNLRETLEKLVEKQRELAVEKMDLLKKEAESDSLAHQLEDELNQLRERRDAERAAFKRKINDAVANSSKLKEEEKTTRSKQTNRIKVLLKGRPAMSGAKVLPDELKQADEMIRNSYAMMGYLSRGGLDEVKL